MVLVASSIFLATGAKPKGANDWYGFGMWGAGPSFFVYLLIVLFAFGVAVGFFNLKKVIRKKDSAQ